MGFFNDKERQSIGTTTLGTKIRLGSTSDVKHPKDMEKIVCSVIHPMGPSNPSQLICLFICLFVRLFVYFYSPMQEPYMNADKYWLQLA